MRRPRVPRQRIVAKTGGQTSVFKSRYMNQVVASTTNPGYGVILVAPAYGRGGNDPGSAIVLYHQEYLVQQSKFIYTPAVGTTTPGTIFVAYLDNPEIIGRFYGASGSSSYSVANQLSIIQSSSHSWSAPIWQELTCSNAGIAPRRKMFSVDSTIPTTFEGFDRGFQGIWVFQTVSTPLATTLGYITEEYTVSVRGPQSALFTSI